MQWMLYCTAQTPFRQEGLIHQMQGVLQVIVSCQPSLGIIFAEDNSLIQGHTSQRLPASSDWFNLGVQRPGPLFAIWHMSLGLLRHLLGLHCCSTSPSTQSAFFCSLLQAAISKALPYICPACNLGTSLPNNPAWNVSSQGKHPGGGSIWLSFGTKNETD